MSTFTLSYSVSRESSDTKDPYAIAALKGHTIVWHTNSGCLFHFSSQSWHHLMYTVSRCLGYSADTWEYLLYTCTTVAARYTVLWVGSIQHDIFIVPLQSVQFTPTYMYMIWYIVITISFGIKQTARKTTQ